MCAHLVPRVCVVIETVDTLASGRPNHPRKRSGCGAPTACVSAGSQLQTCVGSSSQTLQMPGAPRVIAANVAVAASCTWRNDHALGAVADGRQPTFAHHCHDLPHRGDARGRAVEVGVAQDNAFAAVGIGV